MSSPLKIAREKLDAEVQSIQMEKAGIRVKQVNTKRGCFYSRAKM